VNVFVGMAPATWPSCVALRDRICSDFKDSLLRGIFFIVVPLLAFTRDPEYPDHVQVEQRSCQDRRAAPRAPGSRNSSTVIAAIPQHRERVS
jgi:hypothetical protein